jgi:putative tryptophan/tyrosine transport system substrate-binding protein
MRTLGELPHDSAPQGGLRDLVAEVTQAAKALSLQPHLAAARNPEEIDGAFARIIAERAQAVFVFPSSMLFSQRRRVVELITKHALPATFPAREYAQLGGLMAYGASITELWRRSAFYVDRIFKGAKPSELPVEQPTKFELVINLKTAKVLATKPSASRKVTAEFRLKSDPADRPCGRLCSP